MGGGWATMVSMSSKVQIAAKADADKTVDSESAWKQVLSCDPAAEFF